MENFINYNKKVRSPAGLRAFLHREGWSMDDVHKKAAALNMIYALYGCGYIDEIQKIDWLNRLDSLETAMFEEIRAYLLRLLDELTK